MPPDRIGRFSKGDRWPQNFIPAPELREWVLKAIIAPSGLLHNPDHIHLLEADLEFMWAASGFSKAGRYVVGTAEQVTFRSGGWQKERQEQQMCDWFGRVPDFLITVDASFAAKATDAQFCMVVEHELYHVAQALDKYGAKAFDKKTGRAKLKIQGHDVEEFVGVVRRYGVGASIQPLGRLVEAALNAPEVSDAAISGCCGTCLAAAA